MFVLGSCPVASHPLREEASCLANILVLFVTPFTFYEIDNIDTAAVGMFGCVEASKVTGGEDSVSEGHGSTAFAARLATFG